MGYDRGDSFSFDFEPKGIPFGSKSKGKLSPRSYSIQCERKWIHSFLSARKQCKYLCLLGKPYKERMAPYIGCTRQRKKTGFIPSVFFSMLKFLIRLCMYRISKNHPRHNSHSESVVCFCVHLVGYWQLKYAFKKINYRLMRI